MDHSDNLAFSAGYNDTVALVPPNQNGILPYTEIKPKDKRYNFGKFSRSRSPSPKRWQRFDFQNPEQIGTAAQDEDGVMESLL